MLLKIPRPIFRERVLLHSCTALYLLCIRRHLLWRMQSLGLCQGSSLTHTVLLCRAQPLVVRAAAATGPSDQKIRIKLKAYQPHLLQESVGLITEAAQSTGAHAGGPVYLPTRCVEPP